MWWKKLKTGSCKLLIMPKIFQYLSYIIRFYTNEHLPIHVHVQIQQREIKVELILVFKKVKDKEREQRLKKFLYF